MAIKSADQITIVDVTDAYSVMLTSEAYTFIGGTSGTATGLTCTTEAVAFCGTNQCSSVSVTASAITCPTGISATVANSGTSAVKITFTTTSAITSSCEASIPVVVDGITVNKKFSFAVAIKGATGETGSAGKGIKSTEITYQVGTSATSAPTGTWSKTVVSTTAAGQYLWTRTIITYTDNTTSTSYSVAAHGATGAKGDTGDAGADAITLTITSSNGTIFKNSSGSTVLTAHVFKGGIEQTITDAGVCGSLGSIKWYKGSSTSSFSTSKTVTVSATEVTNSLVYTCQLE